MRGVSLMMRHPKVAATSCERCQAVQLDEDFDPVMRGGVELPRVVPPNCRVCPKIALEVRNNKEGECGPKDAANLTDKNYAAYMYYMEIKAGAKMADDPMTRRLCALIRIIEDRITSESSDGATATAMSLVMALIGTGRR